MPGEGDDQCDVGALDDLFERMYEPGGYSGRPSIAPGKLVRAMPLQGCYSIHSGRQLMAQVRCKRLSHRFCGLAMDDAARVPMVFTADPDARPYRKGNTAGELRCIGHAQASSRGRSNRVVA